ncbi:PIN-like domain-containing protein [Rhodococcus gordoniae]
MTDENAGSDTRGLKDLFSPWLDTPSVDEARFFKNGVIALDTNVLLELYRISSTTRDQLLDALSSVKEQLWIPHQVALEYARNRKGCVRDGNKNATGAKKYIGERAQSVEKSLKEALEKVEEFRSHHKAVEEWDPESKGIDIGEIRRLLQDFWKESKREVERANSEIEQSSEDPNDDKILDRLDELLRGHIGEPYSAADLEKHVTHAIGFRFPNYIPPGFRDETKDCDLDAAGDYIAWRQLLDYMSGHDGGQEKLVILVTNDFKPDWWDAGSWTPKPQLTLEMRDEAGAELLMLSSSDFLAGVARHQGRDVPQDAVAELKNVEKRDATYVADLLNDPRYRRALSNIDKFDLPPDVAESLRQYGKLDLPPDVAESFRQYGKLDLPPGFMENFRRYMQINLPPNLLAGMQEAVQNAFSPEVEEMMDNIRKNEGLRKAVYDAQKQMAQDEEDVDDPDEDVDDPDEADERD